MAISGLIGIGLYTPADASRLSKISAPKLTRWLKGYVRDGKEYAPLWKSQVDLGDGHIYLGFQDLMEARIANKFIALGVPALHIRLAINLAREVLGTTRPLSTNHFRTDGRTIFLQTIENDADGRERNLLLNLFKRQYEFVAIIDPLLKDVEFDAHGSPSAWWPVGSAKNILIDPTRSFGQPIDAESGVPVAILANAGVQHGIEGTARSFDVRKIAVRRAMEYMDMTELRRAA